MGTMNELDSQRHGLRQLMTMAQLQAFWTIENEWCVHYIQELQGCPGIQRQIMGRDPLTLAFVNETHWISTNPPFDPCDHNGTAIQFPGSQGLCGLNACSVGGTFPNARQFTLKPVDLTRSGRRGARTDITDRVGNHTSLYKNAEVMFTYFNLRMQRVWLDDYEEIGTSWNEATDRCIGNLTANTAAAVEQRLTQKGWSMHNRYWYPLIHMASHATQFACLMMVLDNPSERQ